MSKVFLVGGRHGRMTRVLEVDTTTEAKSAYSKIKARAPRSSVSIFGAKDVNTLVRTQPNLGSIKVTKSEDEFLDYFIRPHIRNGLRLGPHTRKVDSKRVAALKKRLTHKV